MNSKVLVVGAGGIGSRLVRELLFCNLPELVVMDDDKVEQKNLDRQIFRHEDIGTPKAIILSAMGGAKPCTAWLKRLEREEELRGFDVVFGCTDTMDSRALMLSAVDLGVVPMAIICGNGTDTADAYVYMEFMKGDPRLDPRKRTPSAFGLTPDGHRSCTAAAELDERPQTAVANLAAATAGLQLFHWWMTATEKNKASPFAPAIHRFGGMVWGTEYIGSPE